MGFSFMTYPLLLPPLDGPADSPHDSLCVAKKATPGLEPRKAQGADPRRAFQRGFSYGSGVSGRESGPWPCARCSNPMRPARQLWSAGDRFLNLTQGTRS